MVIRKTALAAVFFGCFVAAILNAGSGMMWLPIVIMAILLGMIQ
jgi:hypothetical protein